MKISIVTTGRFHVLDLARELQRLGHEVAFFSTVPRARLASFGLPPGCVRPLFARMAPWVALRRFGRGRLRDWATRKLIAGVDRAASSRMEPCEAVIGMSGICLEAGISTRRKFGARFILERGSRHILSQRMILAEGRKDSRRGLLDGFEVSRELAGYEAADAVVVPSSHALDSFLEQGFARRKLFRIPYGVDVALFRPTPAPVSSGKTIFYAGEWSFRKGADVLARAVGKMANVRLLHAGLIGDVPFPDDPTFEHLGSLEQRRLTEAYARAGVFVLASREDGFGMVLIQALACGVPVVCTDRTGGPDLREMIPDPSCVTVVRAGDADSLADGIERAFVKSVEPGTMRDGLGSARDFLSWQAYGRRYEAFLKRLLEEARA